MKKFIFAIIAIMVANSMAFAQGVGIGETSFTPDLSSILELKSTTKGLLVPRMTDTQRNSIASPATGLLVYQTNGSPGYYFYNGSSWLLLGTGSLPSGVSGQTLLHDGSAWVSSSLLFNNGTNIGIGTTTPAYKLELIGADASFNGIRVGRGAGNKSTNTTIGFEALFLNTSGSGNTAAGYQAVKNNTTGNYNTGFGYSSLTSVTKGTGNTAVGPAALWSDTTGSYNTALGYNSLGYNLSGRGNTAAGYYSLLFNRTGFSNVAIGAGAASRSTDRNCILAVGDSALFYNGTDASGITEASGNTAVGSKTLFSNTTGYFNTATGYQSLYFSTTGYGNTSLGYKALFNNKANSRTTAIGYQAMYYANSTLTGIETCNTAVGYEALRGGTSEEDNTGRYNAAFGDKSLHVNSTGSFNAASGYCALYSNTTGNYNTAGGGPALYNNTTGSNNTANGYASLYKNETGKNNTACGSRSLYNNLTGFSNIAIGINALNKSTNRNNLVAIGDSALFNNGDGALEWWEATGNTATGSKSLFSNTTGYSNTAYGFKALTSNTSAIENTAIGHEALLSNTSGLSNTAGGHEALANNVTGDDNTAFGNKALGDNNGDQNTAIGSYAYFTLGAPNWENSTAIGYLAAITGNNQVRLGNSSVTSIGGYTGWTNISDIRIKKDVKETVPGISFIMKLRPVTYHLDMDAIASFIHTPEELRHKDAEAIKGKMIQTGFIAQEVENAARELGFDFSGVDAPKNKNDLYGLRYADFVVPIVKAMQEQQAIIEELKSQNADLLNRIVALEKK